MVTTYLVGPCADTCISARRKHFAEEESCTQDNQPACAWPHYTGCSSRWEGEQRVVLAGEVCGVVVWRKVSEEGVQAASCLSSLMSTQASGNAFVCCVGMCLSHSVCVCVCVCVCVSQCKESDTMKKKGARRMASMTSDSGDTSSK